MNHAAVQIPSYTRGFARCRGIAAQRGIRDGLVGLWPTSPGPTGGTLYDWSGRRLDGTLTGMAPNCDWLVDRNGWMLDYAYNSDDRTMVAYRPVLYCHPHMTVSAWARSQTANYSYICPVVAMWDYAGGKRMWSLNAHNDELWSIGISSDGTNTNASAHKTGVAVDSNLHHLAIVVDNSAKTWDFYYDGQFIQTITATRSYSNQGSFLTIGGHGIRGFGGRIGDVALWHRRLTAAEIALMHQDPHALTRLAPRRFGFATSSAETGGPYRVACGQLFHAGAAAGEPFLTATTAGTTFHTGPTAGQLHG